MPISDFHKARSNSIIFCFTSTFSEMEHHNSAHQSGNSQKEEANNLASSSTLYEVTKMKYQDLLIKIFSDSSLENNPRHFFFEPLVLLDPKSIVDKSPKSLKQAFIQFTIQMWNEELRIKVLERLRSLKSLQDVLIEEDGVCVLPFEEVLLVCKSGAIPESTRLTNEPTSYLRSKEKLDFYLLCDEPSLVNALAEDFRQNPEFTVSSWQLKLECRGLSSNSTLIKKPPTFSFNVSILPNEVTCKSSSSEISAAFSFINLSFLFIYLTIRFDKFDIGRASTFTHARNNPRYSGCGPAT